MKEFAFFMLVIIVFGIAERLAEKYIPKTRKTITLSHAVYAYTSGGIEIAINDFLIGIKNPEVVNISLSNCVTEGEMFVMALITYKIPKA